MTKSKKEIRSSGAIVPKVYPLFVQCVEDGLRAGWNRAHKHTPTPTPEEIWEHQQHAIMLEMDQWFHFIEPGVEE